VPHIYREKPDRLTLLHSIILTNLFIDFFFNFYSIGYADKNIKLATSLNHDSFLPWNNHEKTISFKEKPESTSKLKVILNKSKIIISILNR
jgi:hypothetical protein